jgi:hypothetical protein
MPPGFQLRILKKTVLVSSKTGASSRRGRHEPSAKRSGASVFRPNFLAALEELDYPESAGLLVLRGLEV